MFLLRRECQLMGHVLEPLLGVTCHWCWGNLCMCGSLRAAFCFLHRVVLLPISVRDADVLVLVDMA